MNNKHNIVVIADTDPVTGMPTNARLRQVPRPSRKPDGYLKTFRSRPPRDKFVGEIDDVTLTPPTPKEQPLPVIGTILCPHKGCETEYNVSKTSSANMARHIKRAHSS